MVFFLFAFVSEAWNLISGYGGQFSLAHAAFFGVGAYATAISYVDYGLSPWFGLLIGGLLGVVVSLVVGFATFKLRQFFFVLSTLACSEAIHALFTYWRMKVPTGLGTTIPRSPGFMNLTFNSELPYTMISYALLFIIVIIIWFINQTRINYFLRAIKNDEDAAICMGVNVFKVKLLIFSISAFFTAVGGGFYGMYNLYIEPDNIFNVDLMIQYIVFSIVGGMATIPGPIIGTMVLLPLTVFFRGWIGGLMAPLGFFMYGILLVIVILVVPGGILQGIKSFATLVFKKPETTSR
ncbi:MAG: branched-chain amino acid ABC transporter permease [Deltaproteobacteria bacterium]|nr:branched-chain amino acid ABC transporter permease [Deltaproteobacteria bacterium]